MGGSFFAVSVSRSCRASVSGFCVLGGFSVGRGFDLHHWRPIRLWRRERGHLTDRYSDARRRMKCGSFRIEPTSPRDPRSRRDAMLSILGLWRDLADWWTAAVAIGSPIYLNSFATIRFISGLINLGMSPATGLAFMLATSGSAFPRWLPFGFGEAPRLAQQYTLGSPEGSAVSVRVRCSLERMEWAGGRLERRDHNSPIYGG
jgi:hypothetical protein